ncbi:MAG: HDIG domain-containing protein [Gemmatimonadota bacterium]|nr:MAG: HDIG domain-containing protein [Gemmatimonadota bacterium]
MSPKRKRRGAVRLRQLYRRLTDSRGAQVLGRITKNTYRVILLVAGAALIEIAFPASSVPDLPTYEAGMIASEDVIAPITFPVYKPDEDLMRERMEAVAGVPPILELRPDLADSAMAAVGAFFASLDSMANQHEADADLLAGLADVVSAHRVPTSAERLAVLASAARRAQLKAALTAAFDKPLRAGVVESGALGTARIFSLRTGEAEVLLQRDSLRTIEQFYQDAWSYLPSDMAADARTVYNNLVSRFTIPTIRLNVAETEAQQALVRAAVSPIKYEVLEGERIVAAHDRVGGEQKERLDALRAQLLLTDGGWDWKAHLGGFLFNLLLLVAFGMVLRYYRPGIYDSGRSVTLVFVMLLVVAGATALISGSEAPWQLIPIAIAALMLATLYDGLLALVTVFVLVGLLTIRQFPGVSVPFFTFAGGAAAALSGRVVRRRAQNWAFAAVIAGAYVLAAASLALLGLHDVGGLLESSFWGTVNGVGCTLIATGILPLAESFTRITTDQSLLELADLNRPLLRRLSLEAPGTYAHSINVANLAEAAAREIGANSTLVRVGVYYHDIGKLKKPQYFVENQPPGRNPHDKLKPATSAGIVREHVLEGLALVTEARLPDVVKAFIGEHHGTQKIGFFWERAKELEPDAEFDPQEFRYPGPKPQSKETAIALLADSVESAARVLQDPTPENMRALVDRIVDFKLAEGQLDEAPLTLQEITTIKEQFVTVLTSMYHHRLDYPSQNQQVVEKPAVQST